MTEQPDHLKHGRLIQSVFLYVATCLKEGDNQAIHSLRLRADQTERISRMPAADFLRLSELGRQCVTFDIDPDALDQVFKLIDRRRTRDELVVRCIRCDAPREMMKVFFGLSRRLYSRLRSTHGMSAAPGRYPRPGAAVERQIYEHWTAHGRCWSAQGLLEIAHGLNLSLRVIWDQLKQERN